MFVQLGFVRDPFGRVQRRLKQPMQHRPSRANVLRALIRLFHLRQNLRLADDHAFEAGGDTVEVLDDGVVGERQQLPLDTLPRNIMETEQRVDQLLGVRRSRVAVAGRVKLDPVAGRKQYELRLVEAGLPGF